MSTMRITLVRGKRLRSFKAQVATSFLRIFNLRILR
jgi:hypothetical protein